MFGWKLETGEATKLAGQLAGYLTLALVGLLGLQGKMVFWRLTVDGSLPVGKWCDVMCGEKGGEYGMNNT